VQQQIASTTPSPAILPQQRRHSISSTHAASMASPVFVASDSMIDHEASAALLMLNMDRRGASISEEGSDDKSPNSSERKMGMSVRDLLTS